MPDLCSTGAGEQDAGGTARGPCADAIAAALGRLPSALEQAAATLADRTMTAQVYLRLLDDHLLHGTPVPTGGDPTDRKSVV